MLEKLSKIKKDFDISYMIAYNLKSRQIEHDGDRHILEHKGLFDNLFGSEEAIIRLNMSIQGQILPQSWKQGNIKCIVSKPEEDILIGLIYIEFRDAIEAYQVSKQIDAGIGKLWHG